MREDNRTFKMVLHVWGWGIAYHPYPFFSTWPAFPQAIFMDERKESRIFLSKIFLNVIFGFIFLNERLISNLSEFSELSLFSFTG